MKLGEKLRISYVGIIIVAVSIVLVLIIEDAQRDLRDKITKDFETVARIEVENVDAYVNGKLNLVRSLASDPVFLSGGIEEIVRYMKRMQQDNASFAGISIVSPDGKVAASTDTKAEGRPFAVDPGLFKKARNAEMGRIFFRYMAAPGGGLHILACAPITGRTNRDVIYVLAVSLDIREIFKEGPGIPQVAGKPAWLVNNQSTMVITKDGESQIFTPLVYIQDDSRIKGADPAVTNGHVVYMDPVRGLFVAGYAYLSDDGPEKNKWSVIAMAPQKEVFYPAIRLRNRIILLGAIAVAVAWSISFFVARGITRPILKLVKVTDMIAKGNLSQRAEIEHNDEVGDLARSFNKMTDELNMAIVARDQELIERSNAEEKLREEMEAKAKFVSLVSHEFQTPLTMIREGVGILLAEDVENLTARQKDVLRIARKSGESLAHLLDDIVEFHGLEAELIKFHITETDINAVVSDVCNSMAPLLAEKKDIRLIANADRDIPKARFDKDKIALVLTNIVNISIRTTEKGDVKISTCLDGENAIRVSVDDPASAIDRKDLPTLFDKFSLPAKERDKRAGGTGLGLTISREIIKKHNGKIWAEPLEGGGVSIKFVIPVSDRRA